MFLISLLEILTLECHCGCNVGLEIKKLRFKYNLSHNSLNDFGLLLGQQHYRVIVHLDKNRRKMCYLCHLEFLNEYGHDNGFDEDHKIEV